jgi:hypothetical protein
MISVCSRNRLLAVWVAAWEGGPNTRRKGLDAAPESRAVVLDERPRNYEDTRHQTCHQTKLRRACLIARSAES